MKVTFVVPFINLTGGIRVILDYANWLYDAGHEVTVVYPSWPYRFQLTRKQHWVEFRKQSRGEVRVPWFGLRCRLLRVPLIRSIFMPRADVVVATAWPTSPDVARLSASCGRQVQIAFHHETGTGSEERICATYRLPFYRIAFSEFVRTRMEREFGCPVSDVVPNGVDTTLFYPDGPVDPLSVLFLYHPDPRKGAAEGIEALARLRRRRPDVRIRISGTVRPDSLPDWMPPFEFYPDDATLRRRYSTSALLLYPSNHEGFGLPPLEAMACGCPPVTTDVGAVPEFARDRENALVVGIGDIESMTDRMEELLGDPALRHRLSAEGLRTAQHYALTRVAPLFAAALERAAQSA